MALPAAPVADFEQAVPGLCFVVGLEPFEPVQVVSRQPERLRRLQTILALGGRVDVDHVLLGVERDDRILHLREHIAAQAVRCRLGAFQRIDVVADDDGVDLAVAQRVQRLLGVGEPIPQIGVVTPQLLEVVVAGRGLRMSRHRVGA